MAQPAAVRRRRWGGLALLSALLLWLRYQMTHTTTFTRVLSVAPRQLWEHVADFNNQAALSQLITEFDLTEESGTYDDWRYTVTYREKMATLPLIGSATSTFHVQPLPQQDRYRIEGHHRFCYMLLLCSHATSVMQFVPSSLHTAQTPSTRLTERISYDCPLGLGRLCWREISVGRSQFLDELQAAMKRKPW